MTITKLTDVLWTPLVTTTGISAASPALFIFDSTHYFALNNTQDQGGAVTLNMKRSADAGATWSDSLVDAQHMAIDAAGRLWAYTREAANTYKIYYSDDWGVNWTLSYTPPAGVKHSFFLACHPTNRNVIALWATDASSHPVFVTTADRGTSWTVTTPSGTRPDTFLDSVQYQYGFRVLQSGRYVVSGFFTTGPKGGVMTSDDSGVTWTARQTDAANSYLRYGLGGSVSGAKLATVVNAANSAYPWVSIDSGTTWAVLALSQSLQAFTGDATITVRAMVYDQTRDAMYVSTNNAGFTVVKLTPVSDSGVWSNLKFNIPTSAPVNSGMAVIPA